MTNTVINLCSYNFFSSDYYVDNPEEAYYKQEQKRGSTSSRGAPERLETLEPDSEVELIPGAQPPQQPPQQVISLDPLFLQDQIKGKEINEPLNSATARLDVLEAAIGPVYWRKFALVITRGNIKSTHETKPSQKRRKYKA